MFIHSFHVSMNVFVKGSDVSVNLFDGVVKVRSCYIRCDGRSRRDNRKFSMGDVRPEHVFVEGGIVRNIYRLGLLGYL